jgi:hydroxyacylglutathione hydrolase
MDDATEVHPGHGAGSLCGAGIGKSPYSTIGQERSANPMLQPRTKQAFVDAVLADLPETPAYFSRMKRVNQRGPQLLGLADGVAAPAVISALEAFAVTKNGGIILDVRSSGSFGAGHPAGAINIGFGSKVGYWAGWVFPPEAPIVILVESGSETSVQSRTTEVARQLVRVGLDSIAGVVAGGFEAWRATGLPVAAVEQIAAAELNSRLAAADRPRLLDVRTTREWTAGHIDGAVHVPVGDLPARIAEIPADAPVAAICEGGLRSSLATSLLARAGVREIINVSDGMTAYRALELTR